MLRKGDLMEWAGLAKNTGIALEDEKPGTTRILVFWFDINAARAVRVEWMTRIGGQDNEV